MNEELKREGLIAAYWELKRMGEHEEASYFANLLTRMYAYLPVEVITDSVTTGLVTEKLGD